MNTGQTHERLARDHDVKMGSDRGFAMVFAAVFGVIALLPTLKLRGSPHFDPAALRWWALAVAGFFLVAGLLSPSLLHPLNRLWFKIGLLLSKVVTPVVMGALYVLAVIPTGLVMRLRGADPLRLKIDRASKSYWIVREPPGPAGDSMKNQF